ncbi:hypothetical protein NH448_06650 [Halomonas sp. OfavH-34-E]|nr:hypothetical protein [Halomonas sp. OfavH-34-E]
MLADFISKTEDVVVTPESHFFINIYEQYGIGPWDFNTKKDVVAYLSNDFRFSLWGIDIVKLAEQKPVNSLQDIITVCVNEYSVKTVGKECSLWLDHTPHNIRKLSYWENIATGNFELAAIHIVRDGRGVYNSVRKLDWGPNLASTTALWWENNVLLSAMSLSRSSVKTMEIRYEDFLINPEHVLKSVCEKFSICYTKEMIFGGGFKKPSYTLHQHELVGKKASSERSYNWKSELSKDQVDVFERCAGDVLIALGYKLSKYSKRRRYNPIFLSADLFWDAILRKVKWSYNLRRRKRS